MGDGLRRAVAATRVVYRTSPEMHMKYTKLLGELAAYKGALKDAEAAVKFMEEGIESGENSSYGFFTA